MKIRINIYKPLAFVLACALFVGAGFVFEKSYSAALTSVSVTLSNSRLSFRGGLAAGNSEGSSFVIINTTAGSYPSTSAAQLVQGDVARIGSADDLGSYTVATVSSESTFTLTAALGVGHADAADDVISTQSASQTVRFTTANAVANGRFRILVPALADDGASSDGIPDSSYFDFGASAPTVTCPNNATATYDFDTGVATASATTIAGTDYHVFECAYSGTGAVGTAFNGTSNGAIVIDSLLNPAPKSNHTTGTADTYNIIIQHLDSSLAVVDSTAVGVGVIEAVRVTASVPAQITFRIIGLATGETACGVDTNVTTTAAAVPFGEIPLDAFTDAAHSLTVSTNAANGYSVTAIENDQLGRNGGACAGDPISTTNSDCIQDSRGDGAVMSHTDYDGWDATSTKGFAYSLDDVNSAISNGNAEAFSYDENTGACSGLSYCAKQFADAEDGQAAQEIFGSDDVADNENLNVCYRIIPAVTTAAGNYENYLTYTATATF